MPRSDEAEWWINAVYETVQLIPAGRVTTYGHIALILGERMFPPISLSLIFLVYSTGGW
jgi:methylated-DNA-protein-cysteine methyltransferase related protein